MRNEPGYKFLIVSSLVILFACILIIVWRVMSHKLVNVSESVLKVVFLDVGQGDSIFIETPSHIQILIDAGAGSKILEELGTVMKPWDRSIDIIIATHPDKDHIGGLPDVLENYEIQTIIDNGFDADKQIVKHYLNNVEIEVKTENAKHIIHRMTSVTDFSDGVELSFLQSLGENDKEIINSNDGSLIVRVEYGESSFLFTGDASSDVEELLISNNPTLIDVDVLKLGHHGSKTSSSQHFLDTVTPTMAVISAGINNSYHHPHPSVLSMLKSKNIPYLCTCDHGRITFISDGTSIFLR